MVDLSVNELKRFVYASQTLAIYYQEDMAFRETALFEFLLKLLFFATQRVLQVLLFLQTLNPLHLLQPFLFFKQGLALTTLFSQNGLSDLLLLLAVEQDCRLLHHLEVAAGSSDAVVVQQLVNLSLFLWQGLRIRDLELLPLLPHDVEEVAMVGNVRASVLVSEVHVKLLPQFILCFCVFLHSSVESLTVSRWASRVGAFQI